VQPYMTDTASPFRVQIFRKNLRPKSDRLLVRDLFAARKAAVTDHRYSANDKTVMWICLRALMESPTLH
jgi:hypothetical protein